MYRIFSRFDTGALCEWHECIGCVSPVQLGEFESARAWLSGFLLDEPQESVLRQLAHRCGDGLGVAQYSGHELVDSLARMIASGHLRVCQRQSMPVADEPMVLGNAPSGAAAAPPPVSRRRSAPVAPPPAEPSTLPQRIDAGTMAAVLTRAAADGTPFCEICEQARRARAPEPEVVA